MRFIPANCLRPGHVLARNIRLDKHLYILREGVELTADHIKRIKELGFQGAYIHDKFSQNLHVDNVISDELRFTARKNVKSLFVSLEQQNFNKAEKEMDSMEDIVIEIVDEISFNKNVVTNMIDLRTFDDYTFSHCVNVAVMSALIGTSMKLPKKDLHNLTMGAIIHDIGKVFIDIELLNKPEKLTDEEFEELKRHVNYGYDYVFNNDKIPEETKLAMFYHHERFQGGGYPHGLKDTEIPLFSRIISVADVYDALTTNRPYRDEFLPSDAIEFIMSGYGTQFDPKVVDNFITRVSPYPVGTIVKLSTGAKAVVIRNHLSSGLRPDIQIIENDRLTSTKLNLSKDRDTFNITINGIVDEY